MEKGKRMERRPKVRKRKITRVDTSVREAKTQENKFRAEAKKRG